MIRWIRYEFVWSVVGGRVELWECRSTRYVRFRGQTTLLWWYTFSIIVFHEAFPARATSRSHGDRNAVWIAFFVITSLHAVQADLVENSIGIAVALFFWKSFIFFKQNYTNRAYVVFLHTWTFIQSNTIFLVISGVSDITETSFFARFQRITFVI